MTTPYFEIGAWSNFSFLEGASHPGEMIVAASRLGISGLGIADRNTVAGVVRAHAQAKVDIQILFAVQISAQEERGQR